MYNSWRGYVVLCGHSSWRGHVVGTIPGNIQVDNMYTIIDENDVKSEKYAW